MKITGTALAAAMIAGGVSILLVTFYTPIIRIMATLGVQ